MFEKDSFEFNFLSHDSIAKIVAVNMIILQDIIEGFYFDTLYSISYRFTQNEFIL